ncbi:MAG: metal-sulfur cluster assembly factor [Candidatus Woesebacteria bacterium]
MTPITTDSIWTGLKKVIDPELNINIVDLGLVYKVELFPEDKGVKPWVVITMTLTSPGCPMAAVFDRMTKDALWGTEGLDVDKDIKINLTFDPPWVSDMMSEEAKAELGL